jgi:hypothetical protein
MTHWVVLASSCAAILAGIETAQTALAILGLGGMMIGVWLGVTGRA